MSRPPVCFITVNYKSAVVTRAYVESLATLDAVEQCEIAVVDNAADAESRANLSATATRFPGRLHLFHLEENRFYWPGAAYAIERLYPTPEQMPDWLIVSNNDIAIADRGFVGKLLAYDPERFGVIAPSILSAETGKDQNPFLRKELGALERLKWRSYYSHYLVARSLLGLHRLWSFARERMRGRANGGPGAGAREEVIYAPHGACIIFSKAYFRRGGYLDTNFSLYGEEITVAEIARRIGVPVVYCPRLQVLHQEHAATGRRLTRELYRMEREAYTYFSRRYL